jgi:hypothetical protein
MSVKVRCIHYDTINLATYKDLEVFNEELTQLITSGFSLSLELFATNNMENRTTQYVLPNYFRKKEVKQEGSTSTSNFSNLV